MCYDQVILLRAVLKNCLALPNVFVSIKNFIAAEIAKNNGRGIYTSFFQGSVWKNISKILTGKIFIPLYFYYDVFEINNPLSTSAGFLKIGGLYCSIAA